MTDIAALGLKVDGVDNIDKARDSLGRFTKSAEGAEKSSDALGKQTKKTGSEFDAASKLGGSFSKALTSMRSVALGAATALIGVATAAVGLGAATTTLAGFEKSMSAVQAVTRSSAADMVLLRDEAKRLGAATEFSASQAADGLMYLGLAGWSAQESIAAIPAVVDLATAASMGLAEAADTTSNIMSAFGIAAADAAKVTDVLAAASSRANTDVSQLGEGIKYVGPVAAAMGISVGDVAAAMGVLADAGIQASMGGTGLRRVLSSLANPTKESIKVINSMGLSIEELNPKFVSIEDIVTRLAGAGLTAAEALTIFGDRGGPAILALTDGLPKLKELTGTLKDVDDESRRMADTMRDNLSGDLDGLKSATEGVVIAMGEAGLTKALRLATQAATEFMRAMTSVIDFLGDNSAAVTATFAALFGPKIISTAIAGFKLLGAVAVTALKGIAAVVIANPITAAIAATAAFLVYLYKIKDEVSAIGAVWDLISEPAVALWDSIKSASLVAWNAVKEAWGSFIGLFTETSDGIEMSWHTAMLGITGAFDSMVNGFLGNVSALGAAFRALGYNIGIAFSNAFNFARESLSEFLLQVSGALQKIGVDVSFGYFESGGMQDFISITDEAKAAYESMAGTVDTQLAYITAYWERETAKQAQAWADGVITPTKKASEAVKENTRSVSDNGKASSEAAKAAKRFNEERERAIKSQYENISKLQDERRALEDQVRLFGLGKRAIEQLTISRLKEQAAVLNGFKGSEEQVKLLQMEIEEREKLLKAGFSLDALEAGKKAADELAAEVKKTHDEIERSLTDALMRGFESGKGFGKNLVDTLKNMFATLVLRPIIQPVATGVAGAVTSALGIDSKGGFNFGNIKSLSDIGSAISGGLTAGVSGAIGSLGSALGSSALQHFALGMSGKGAVLGAGLAGPTTATAGGAVSAGAAAGAALPWVAGGLAAYQLISSFMNKGETRHGGGFGYDPTTGTTSFAGGPSGGYGGRQTLGAVEGLFKGAADTINSVFKGVGADVTTAFFHGAFESSGKGRGGVFSGGDIRLADGTVVGFGGSRKGDGFGGRSGSSEEMFSNLQQDISYSVLEAWKAAGDALPETIREGLQSVDIRALGAEAANEMVQGITSIVSQVNDVQRAFEALPLNSLKTLSFDAANALIQFSGGMEQLMSNMGGYYNNFFSETEKQLHASRALAQQLRDVNVTLPNTRQEFRQIVEALDLTTQAGQATFAALMNAADAANDYYHAIESASSSISSSISSLYEHITLDIMETDGQRYNYYKNQFETFSAQLNLASDAQTINDLVQKMTQAASSAYNLVDEESRKGGLGKEYLATLDELERISNERLEAAHQKAVEDKARELEIVGSAIAGSLVASLDASGAAMERSASQIGAWAAGVNSNVSAIASALSRMRSSNEVNN